MRNSLDKPTTERRQVQAHATYSPNGSESREAAAENGPGAPTMPDRVEHEPKDGHQPAALGSDFYYTFLGECYVHGLMDGQGTNKRVQDRIPYEIFEIR